MSADISSDRIVAASLDLHKRQIWNCRTEKRLCIGVTNAAILCRLVHPSWPLTYPWRRGLIDLQVSGAHPGITEIVRKQEE